MKLSTFVLAGLVAVFMGCSSPKVLTETDAPDGFYIEAAGLVQPYALRVVPSSGGRVSTFRIEPYTAFVPEHVIVFDTSDGYYVQIDGRATVKEWLKQGIFIVAEGRPYFDVSKSGQAVHETGERVGPSATISLVLPTREEADTVASALRRRYSL